MKNSQLITLIFILLATTMSGCDLVGDILEFGFWTGIIAVVIIILIVVGIFRMLKR